MNLCSIDQTAFVLLHQQCRKMHNGATGLREAHLLELALNRPLGLLMEAEPDIAALAASYAVGIIRHQPFLEGNESAAFLAMGLFLSLNGWCLTATQIDATHTMQALASGDLDEAMLADWIRANL